MSTGDGRAFDLQGSSLSLGGVRFSWRLLFAPCMAPLSFPVRAARSQGSRGFGMEFLGSGD